MASLLSSCQRKDWNKSKMTKRMIGFRESIVVVLLVREQPRYKVIQNITQYTNLQLFFSETFISLGKRFQTYFFLIYNYLLFHDWIRLLSYQEIYRKKRESAKGKRNNKHTAEKRCGQTIRETDYFSTFSLTACLTRKCKDKLE